MHTTFNDPDPVHMPVTQTPQIAVAQLGARMNYAVPRILHKAGMLNRLYTDICATKGWPRLLRYLPTPMRTDALQRLLDRTPRSIPRDRVTAFPGFGLSYALKVQREPNAAQRINTFLWAGRTFTQKVLREGLEQADGIYVFSSAGLEVLSYARAQGKHSVLEQPIAPKAVEAELLETEAQRFPEWHTSPSTHVRERDYVAREQAEWKQASVILCPSPFVRDSIARCGGPTDRCMVVPYGIDLQYRKARTRMRQRRKLRVLTIGTVNLRKGAPYVLEASRQCSAFADFRMVGRVDVSERAERMLASQVDLVGHVPYSEIDEHYEWADVFLLPSLCEGSATVTYEALAAGLPVICTHNTGSIVRSGKEGFIVPVRNAEAIAEKLELLHSENGLLEQLSRHAIERAKEGSMDAYAKRLLRAITEVVPEQSTR